MSEPAKYRIYTPWRRAVAECPWACDCGCTPVGHDIEMVRKCLRTMADEIDRLRTLIGNAAREADPDLDDLLKGH